MARLDILELMERRALTNRGTPTLEVLPESHSDFPFSLTLESWRAVLVVAVLGVVVAIALRRRRTR
jgi:cell division protein FtsW (lipid II flippase)